MSVGIHITCGNFYAFLLHHLRKEKSPEDETLK